MTVSQTRRRLTLATAVATAVFGAGCVAPRPQSRTLVDTIASDPRLTTLNKLIRAHGLVPLLSEPGPYTFFAPTDAAFKAVPARAWDSLAKHPERVAELLKFHIVPGRMTLADVRNGTAPTLLGAMATLSKSGQFITFEDAVVESGDLPASNGVIHLLDRVTAPATP